MRPQALRGDAHEAAARDRLQIVGRRAEKQPARPRPGGSAPRPAAHRARARDARARRATGCPRGTDRASRHAGSVVQRRAGARSRRRRRPRRGSASGFPAPLEAPDREPGHRGRSARGRHVHEQRLAAVDDAEVVDLRRARVPAARPDPLRCRASRRAPDSRGPARAGRAGSIRLGWLRASEPKALIEPWASPIRSIPSGAGAWSIHAVGSASVRRRASGAGSSCAGSVGQRDRRGLEVHLDVGRQAAAQHAVPRPARLMRIVVARDQVPAHRRRSRASARSAGRACGPPRSRRRRCRRRPARSARPPPAPAGRWSRSPPGAPPAARPWWRRRRTGRPCRSASPRCG